MKMASNSAPEDVKFAADFMLGRLAKWLRIIGCDVIYGRHLTGYGLIRAARSEDRLILTRDRRLKQKQPPPFVLIESDHYRDQLRQVIGHCGIHVGENVFSRCVECNAVLQARARDEVESLVPAYVYSSQTEFSFCPICRRIYWPATHREKMLEQLRNLRLA